MRRLLRIVAWLVMVGGCFSGTIGVALLTLAELHGPHALPQPGSVISRNVLSGFLTVVHALAVGGGLLLLLDLDRRLAALKGAA